MAINKKATVCTIENPDGTQYNKTLSFWSGDLLPLYSPSGQTKGLFNYQNRPDEVISLDIPEGIIDLTWKIYCSGEYNGRPLPPIIVRVQRNDLTRNLGYINTYAVAEDGDILIRNWIRGDKINSKVWIAFAHNDEREPEGVSLCVNGSEFSNVFYNGEMQSLPVLTGLVQPCSATAYYNAMSTITVGYPFGPASDPTRYESKPTDASGATMDDDSDPIEIDNLPSAVAAGGLFRVYELTRQQMTTVSNTLASPTIYDTLVKMVTSPLDYFIKLQAMPVDFPSYSEDLRFGNYTITGLGSHILSNFITDVDCGQVSLPLYFSSFLDYAPATSVTLYLPFIGYVPLNVDLFVDDVIKLKYRVDAVSGDCVAFVSNSQGLVTTFSGNCAYNLPLRANDMSQVVAGLYSTVSGIATGQAQTAINGVGDAMGGVMKPAMISAGGLSSNSGSMTNRKPYVVIERPVPAVPKSYGETVGFASRISAKLSTLKGYTRIEEIHLDHVNATREEKAELERLLKEGVIL